MPEVRVLYRPPVKCYNFCMEPIARKSLILNKTFISNLIISCAYILLNLLLFFQLRGDYDELIPLFLPLVCILIQFSVILVLVLRHLIRRSTRDLEIAFIALFIPIMSYFIWGMIIMKLDSTPAF